MSLQSNSLRTYSELILLPTFVDRFEFLRLNGRVGEETFGWERYINQEFYHSQEWHQIRDYVIIRDNGCDLAFDGYFIRSRIHIHHMNPVTTQDIMKRSRLVLDPQYLVCVSLDTHNAIHYGDASKLRQEPVIRRPNDTCPWKD